eukprot:gnl/Spiro4/16696_TR8983_c0_g1_i1.p1 gnl/Spiro4/16696_TR8983_c0_g1~~gnl/Spiro4/16696_TR8983_c0_g1_i1.p1  ORF type:complete len:476 (-),score=121.31 gnl/Spiro4/16696_TR8983_c0_g1_i1:7-1434(-)
MSEVDLRKWVTTRLQLFLGFEHVQDIATSLLQEQDEAQFMSTLLTMMGDTQNIREFGVELLARKKRTQEPDDGEMLLVPRDSAAEVFGSGPRRSSGSPHRRSSQRHHQQQPQNPPSSSGALTPSAASTASNINNSVSPHPESKKGTRATLSRFAHVLLPGRHPCTCQAQKHPLVTNCLNCGRVVCAQEGAGPCLFCGHFVGQMPKAERKEFKRRLREQEAATNPRPEPIVPQASGVRLPPGVSIQRNRAEPTKEEKAAARQKAREDKNKLLHFQQTSARRTTVIDDQADWYDSTLWMDPDQKKAFLEKRESEKRAAEARKRQVMVSFDFAGRRVLSAPQDGSIRRPTENFFLSADARAAAEAEADASRAASAAATSASPSAFPDLGVGATVTAGPSSSSCVSRLMEVERIFAENRGTHMFANHTLTAPAPVFVPDAAAPHAAPPAPSRSTHQLVRPSGRLQSDNPLAEELALASA